MYQLLYNKKKYFIGSLTLWYKTTTLERDYPWNLFDKRIMFNKLTHIAGFGIE